MIAITFDHSALDFIKKPNQSIYDLNFIGVKVEADVCCLQANTEMNGVAVTPWECAT